MMHLTTIWTVKNILLLCGLWHVDCLFRRRVLERLWSKCLFEMFTFCRRGTPGSSTGCSLGIYEDFVVTNSHHSDHNVLDMNHSSEWCQGLFNRRVTHTYACVHTGQSVCTSTLVSRPVHGKMQVHTVTPETFYYCLTDTTYHPAHNFNSEPDETVSVTDYNRKPCWAGATTCMCR